MDMTKDNPVATRRHPLEAYADSYAQMSRHGDGRISCRSVEVDIRQNMIPVTIASPVQAGIDPLVAEIIANLMKEIEYEDGSDGGPPDIVYGSVFYEAAALLRSQAERIAALEVERDAAREYGKEARILGTKAEDKRIHEQHRASVAESLLAEAREALEPFAAVLDDYDPEDEADYTPGTFTAGSVTHYDLELGDFRRARATLSRLKPGEKGGANAG